MNIKSIIYKKIFNMYYPLKTKEEQNIFFCKNRYYMVKLIDKIRRKTIGNNVVLQYQIRDNVVKVPFKNRYIADMSKQRKLEKSLEKNEKYLNLLEAFIFEIENGKTISLDTTNKFLYDDRFIWR